MVLVSSSNSAFLRISAAKPTREASRIHGRQGNVQEYRQPFRVRPQAFLCGMAEDRPATSILAAEVQLGNIIINAVARPNGSMEELHRDDLIEGDGFNGIVPHMIQASGAIEDMDLADPLDEAAHCARHEAQDDMHGVLKRRPDEKEDEKERAIEEGAAESDESA